MARIVRIHGDRAVFPANACVHCLRPATREVEIVKVKGHRVRKVNVPFCDRCIALRHAKSPRQVLFERVATVNSGLLALTVGAWTYMVACGELSRAGCPFAPVGGGMTPHVDLGAQPATVLASVESYVRLLLQWVYRDRVWMWALLLGALSALVVFGVIYLIVSPWSWRFRNSETKAALRAVTIVDFDWETTTLEFADDEYAHRFAQVNQYHGG